MDDPAGHTWVREYRLDASRADWPHLEMLSSRFLPQEKELRYPQDPAGVVYTASSAHWYELDAELLRYFAAPAAAAALRENPAVRRAMYGPGRVQPGAPGPDGTVGFAARLSLYETTHCVWGQVACGRDARGRPVIASLTVEGTADVLC